MRGETEQRGDGGDGGRTDEDLGGPEAENHFPQHPEPRWLQFEPDDEEQEHDTEFGEVQDVVGVVNETESERPDDDAGGQVSEHRAETETATQGDHRNSRDEKNDRF